MLFCPYPSVQFNFKVTENTLLLPNAYKAILNDTLSDLHGSTNKNGITIINKLYFIYKFTAKHWQKLFFTQLLWDCTSQNWLSKWSFKSTAILYIPALTYSVVNRSGLHFILLCLTNYNMWNDRVIRQCISHYWFIPLAYETIRVIHGDHNQKHHVLNFTQTISLTAISIF